jgi:putative ABC transport system permease protein
VLRGVPRGFIGKGRPEGLQMLRYYLVTAVRGLLRHKLYSFINVAGFSIALAAAILITLYVRDQLSYDTWIPGTSHVYRLERAAQVAGAQPLRMAGAPYPVVKVVGEEIPAVKAFTHVMPEQMTVHAGARLFHETVTVVDPDFFQVIRLPLTAGDPARVLSQPESIVLSQAVARKLFGSADPVGRTVTVSLDRNDSCGGDDASCLDASYPLTVTGVLRDLPHNTQLIADLVMPNTSRADALSAKEKASDWRANDGDYGYLELSSNAKPEAVAAAMGPIIDGAFDYHRYGLTAPVSHTETYSLRPFRDVHLASDAAFDMRPSGSRAVVYGLSIIALLLVLVACCNFMNLATARATLRAREVAVRKVAGAGRRQLVAQFLAEAVISALVSFAIALSLVEVLLPAFDRFVGEPIALHYGDWRLLAALTAGAVAVGLLSGFYPAFVISALRPAVGLKPAASERSGSEVLRSVLVVVQFGISIGLAIAAVVVLRQINFARHADLGIRRDGVVVIQGIARLTPSQRDSLADALKNNAGIESVAYSVGSPFALHGFFTQFQVPGQPPLQAEAVNMSPEFPALYGMRLLAGRPLSKDRAEDASSVTDIRDVLINATAARRIGLSAAQAVGTLLRGLGDHATVVGVLSDANLRGVQDAQEPMIFWFAPSDAFKMTDLSVRIRTERSAQTLSFIDRTWRQFQPGAVIQRRFVSQTFDDFLRSADHEGVLLGFFVVIAIFIACLGLFGLAVFTAERRTKEIGVRKVVGARASQLVWLMLWRISIPVLTANVIAWPVAYYYLHRWLEGYAYRVPLNPLYFLASGAAALLIAWATVYAITVRLARTNPVHALRYE